MITLRTKDEAITFLQRKMNMFSKVEYDEN